ncbi:MAG: hypothetical protein HY958_02060 [Bacteroidia bacterium]|nr:hypothetical protein [Bacteroidia bacterium]
MIISNNKIKFLLFLIIVLYYSIHGFPQNDTNNLFKGQRDSLKILFKSIGSSRDDTEKKKINKQILKIVNSIVLDKRSFDYQLDWLHDSIPFLGKLKSSDSLLRILNWNIVYEDGGYEYFGFLQHFSKNRKDYHIFQLIDRSKEIKDPEDAALSNQIWFGALYYQIIENKSQGTIYYTLLGWDGYNELKNRKIMDVLYFNKEGSPKFGALIFNKENKEMKRRIIFEYANRASMILSFNEDLGMIVCDHLSPSGAEFKNMYQYYGPDGSYDAFKFKKGIWNYLSDIDARNLKPENSKKKKKVSKDF